MNLDTRRTQVVPAALGDKRKREGRLGIRRQGKAGKMELSGRYHGGHATVHVVGNPGEGILCRGKVAEGGMRMGIDQSGDGSDTARVNHGIRAVAKPIADNPDDPILDINGIRASQRALQVSRDQSADVFYKNRRHAGTIANRL